MPDRMLSNDMISVVMSVYIISAMRFTVTPEKKGSFASMDENMLPE